MEKMVLLEEGKERLWTSCNSDVKQYRSCVGAKCQVEDAGATKLGDEWSCDFSFSAEHQLVALELSWSFFPPIIASLFPDDETPHSKPHTSSQTALHLH